MSDVISILGGGPAGSAAALAALGEGKGVRLIEKSKLPRHKVCGEFFSPEIAVELERLRIWDAFLAAGPAPIQRMKLHFGRREKSARLPEPAWGLSRYAFDGLLIDSAVRRGAEVVRENGGEPPAVIASGRRIRGPGQMGRLFGFKTHFTGPVNDAIELFFFDKCYVGISAVENGETNVCGLGPEEVLAHDEFDYDRVVRRSPALAARLAPMQRSMKWLSTGPLVYGQAFQPNEHQYHAGDALSFVDPFTGSGLLAAVKTGSLAGRAAARREPVADYLSSCRSSLKAPFEVASVLRAAVDSGWADWLAPLIPSRVLFSLTRPK